MQTVTTLPILQTVSDATTHYIGLQPALSGKTNAEYVNRNISFNPAANTLNIGVNVQFLPNAINGISVADSSLPGNKVSPINRLIENAYIIPGRVNGNIKIFIADSSVYYLTGNTADNVTFDLYVSPSANIDALLSVGQSITTAFITTQGSVQYTANIAVDGVYQLANTRWTGNSKPTYASSLSSSQIDVYTFTTIKIGANSYSILGSRTTYGYG